VAQLTYLDRSQNPPEEDWVLIERTPQGYFLVTASATAGEKGFGKLNQDPIGMLDDAVSIAQKRTQERHISTIYVKGTRAKGS